MRMFQALAIGSKGAKLLLCVLSLAEQGLDKFLAITNLRSCSCDNKPKPELAALLRKSCQLSRLQKLRFCTGRFVLAQQS